jgi:hypothetical protein
MTQFSSRALLAMILCCSTVELVYGSGPGIGLAIADGSFQLDHSRVWGNATLFEGNVIETGASASQLRINDGVNARLASESRARVYRSRLVLEKGIGELTSVNYRIDAATLHIMADGPGAVARVEVNSPTRVIVAAREGAIRVTNSAGILVARLDAGREMAFEPQSGATGAATQISGCLLRKNGKFIVIDQTTNVTMELEGAGLASELGNRVEITGTAGTGTPSVDGASQLIQVTSIKRIAKGSCASIAKKAGAAAGGAAAAGAAGAGAAAGGAAAAGLSTAAVVAIVGGVAAVGTTVGLAAAGELPGQGQSQPSASR